MNNEENSSAIDQSNSTPVSTPVPIPTREIMLHKEPHNDEVVGGTIVRSYVAQEYFPGADKAVVSFVEKDIPGTDEMFDSAQKLPLGCGGDVRFNDHRGPDGRIAGECTATLVAKYLEIDGLPAYQRLLEETLWCDTHKVGSSTLLPSVLKAVNRHMPNNSLRVFEWGEDAIDAIIERERWGYAAVSGEMSLTQIFAAYRRKVAKNCDASSLDRLEDAIGKSERNGTKSVLELSYIVGALARRCDPDTHLPDRKPIDVMQWCQLAFESMYDEQTEFLKEKARLEIEKPHWFTIQAELAHRDRKLKLISFQSESRASLSVALSLGADVILIRDSVGHMRIHTRKGIYGMDLESAASMIRVLMSQAAKNPITHGNWTALGKGGEHDDAPGLYHDVQGVALLNKSESHEAEPINIATQTLIEILLFAFHPDGVREWCNERAIYFTRGRNKELLWSFDWRRWHADRQPKHEPKQVPDAAKPAQDGVSDVAKAFDEALPLKKGKKGKKGDGIEKGPKKPYNRRKASHGSAEE